MKNSIGGAILSKQTHKDRSCSEHLPKLLTVLTTVALTAFMALTLAGCAQDNGNTDSSGAASIANPIVEVADVAAINKLLDINLQVPQDATIQSTAVIGDTLGDITFTLEGTSYNYRGAHATESEDISGLYFDFTSHEEGTSGGVTYLIEFNEGGPGYSRWFDEAAGVTYSVSVDTGASKDLLAAITVLLITEQG